MKKSKPTITDGNNSNKNKIMYIVTFQGNEENTKNITSLFGLDDSKVVRWAIGKNSCYGFVGNGNSITKTELKEKMKELFDVEGMIIDLGVTLFSNSKESENKKIVVSMRLTKEGRVREDVNPHWNHEVNPFNMG